jgi:hypothetical protein
MNKLLLGLAIIAMAAVGWWLLDPSAARHLGAVREATRAVTGANTAPGPAAPGGVHKCKKGGSVIYTDTACPPGMQDLAVNQGTVTVVPAVRPAPEAAVAGPAGSAPALRQLNGSDLREKQIDRAVYQ